MRLKHCNGSKMEKIKKKWRIVCESLQRNYNQYMRYAGRPILSHSPISTYWWKLALKNDDIQKVRTMNLTNEKTHNKFITNYVDNLSLISQIFIIRKSIGMNAITLKNNALCTLTLFTSISNCLRNSNYRRF